jgi:hypothetical protein
MTILLKQKQQRRLMNSKRRPGEATVDKKRPSKGRSLFLEHPVVPDINDFFYNCNVMKRTLPQLIGTSRPPSTFCLKTVPLYAPYRHFTVGQIVFRRVFIVGATFVRHYIKTTSAGLYSSSPPHPVPRGHS